MFTLSLTTSPSIIPIGPILPLRRGLARWVSGFLALLQDLISQISGCCDTVTMRRRVSRNRNPHAYPRWRHRWSTTGPNPPPRTPRGPSALSRAGQHHLSLGGGSGGMRCEPLMVSDWCLESHQWRRWNGGSPLPVCRNGVCACGELGSRADPRTEVRLWEGPDREPTPAGSVQHIENWRYEGHFGASSTSRSRLNPPQRLKVIAGAGCWSIEIEKATTGATSIAKNAALSTTLDCLSKIPSPASGFRAPMSQSSPACRGIRDSRYKEHATSLHRRRVRLIHDCTATVLGPQVVNCLCGSVSPSPHATRTKVPMRWYRTEIRAFHRETLCRACRRRRP